MCESILSSSDSVRSMGYECFFLVLMVFWVVMVFWFFYFGGSWCVSYVGDSLGMVGCRIIC